jgi:hypothetical protein
MDRALEPGVPFELATWEELLALLEESGPDELVRQVRAAEAVDPEGRQWPWTKRSNDATAVYLDTARLAGYGRENVLAAGAHETRARFSLRVGFVNGMPYQ